MATAQNPFVAEWVYKSTPSRWLLRFIVILHLAVGIITGLMPLSLVWKLVLAVTVAGSLIYNYALYSGYWAAGWVAQLCWREFGGWELTTGQGKLWPVIFCDSSFYSTWLVVLNFKTRQASGGRRFRVILLADNCSAEQWCHLCRRLSLL